MGKFGSIFISFVTVFTILAAAAVIIAYGRGYRLDFTKSSLKPTGLISASSDPSGAQVYIDSILKTATNNSFNIDPGFYTVRISKEGYISWEKTIRVQGEIVSQASAFLFPTSPSLSPLTSFGVTNAILSPDGRKVAYVIPEKGLDSSVSKKAGLWYYELTEGPLGRNRDPVQLDDTSGMDFALSTITWSPDATQLLIQQGTRSRLYTLANTNTFVDVSLARIPLLTDWLAQTHETDMQKLVAFKKPIIDMATAAAKIISFSPDETKFLYQATRSATISQVIVPPLIGTNSTDEQRKIEPGKFYVYDSREDKNYFLLDQSELGKSGSASSQLHWFPTSKHIILTLNGKIDVMEYDRTNWITIYSGPFESDFVAPWTNGSRIIILTNLNGDALSLPNLYTVNLR